MAPPTSSLEQYSQKVIAIVEQNSIFSIAARGSLQMLSVWAIRVCFIPLTRSTPWLFYQFI
jgi:hypothetical protein